MKILWVEDFGQKTGPSTLVDEVFSEILSEANLSEEYDETNTDVSGQLSALFGKYTLHEVYVCRSYLEWKEIDEQHGGDFDIALIDINLESYKTPKRDRPQGIHGPDFDKRAGFYIYHQLIKRGFPDDDIAFFTAEGKSLKEFSEYCGDILLDPPKHSFEKRLVFFELLRRWLAEKAAQPSLIMRRGIIDGCRYMKEKIAAIDRSDLGSRLIFYKTLAGVSNGDPEALRRDSIDYITRLELLFLPHRTHDTGALYKTFINELSSRWEESKWSYVRRQAAPQFASWLEDQFRRASHVQMKLLRNWFNHRLLAREVSAKEVAYFFMTAMRAWVLTDLNEIAQYERVLSTLFASLSDLELQRLMNSELGFRLERSYEQLKALHKDVMRLVRQRPDDKKAPNNLNKRVDNYFLGMFQELGEVLNWLEQVEQVEPAVIAYHRRRIRDVSINLFYQSFWHGLFPMQIRTTFYADLQTLRFYIEPLPDSFLSFMGQTIFEECFKEIEVSISVA
jgi:NTP pyrophosphatase (non-canonical NTP hydrolase)